MTRCPDCGMRHNVERCRIEVGTCDCCRSIIGPVLP